MMRYSFILFLSILISTQLRSQSNPRNLDFESGDGKGNFFPWMRSNYSNAAWNVSLDSQVKYNGHYAVHFSRDSSLKKNCDGVIFNTMALDVPAKNLTIVASVLQSNPEDSAGFISVVISQDIGERKTITRGRRINGAAQWTELRWQIPLDSLQWPIHHLRLNIGAKGRSDFWVDDIKILADGTDVYSIPSFASSDRRVPEPLTNQELVNLEYLCYTWGLLKYFHPIIATGYFNMDAELFRMIPVVRSATNNEELSAILLTWIESFGKITATNLKNDPAEESLFKKNIDLSWISDKSISKALRAKLNFILENRHQGNSFYTQYRNISNLDFLNENDYANWRNIGFPNINFRLQFLFRYWNMIQYFYPYKYLIGDDWRTILSNFIPRFAVSNEISDYHLLMSELVNSVQDSHSGLYDPIVIQHFAPLKLPVQTMIIEKKAVITGFLNDSLGKLSGLKKGDVINTIDGKTIESIIREFEHLVNGSNETVKIAYMNSLGYITGGRDSLTKLSVTRNGLSQEIISKRYAYFSLTTSRDSAKWKKLNQQTGYVHMGNLEAGDIPLLFAELGNSRTLIFDLRHYPKSSVYPLSKYVYSVPMAFARTMAPDLDFPGRFIWKGNIVYGPTAADSTIKTYKGRIIILVNENTQSQAEWTCMMLQALPGSITIGGPTSGTDGDVSRLSLTGGYFTNMTGIGVYYPDGSQTQRTGVRIDIPTRPTIAGVIAGKDELLEKAMELASH